MTKNKVKICTQGFSQKYGVDYENTYSPAGKFNSLRRVLTIAALKELKVHHIDAVAAFLNPKLVEQIYMKIPPFIPKYGEGKVWKVRKPLYGLKQASRYSYLDISNHLKSIKPNPRKSGPCLFISTDCQSVTQNQSTIMTARYHK
ncbi:hypothetical protein O181_074873 [Austropuccinia psidii MF-1]|uniref:Reverse transcriptase Ty1/copia-type domain-containing protein n=1 Tax=Austropuccinia psidii MF-1 TaxID=1389203 RepID=A0A9Q3F7R5_9BASI|nr:hypothetical protein [Austropuccinia psidii MF-1]